MLIKWVTVRVVDRAAFRDGQGVWAALRRRPGFVGQLGGWSRRDDGMAHIFGGWTDELSYQAFMADAHDGLAAAQAGTYEAIEVRLLEHRLDIGTGLFSGTGHAQLIRLADCHVPTHRQAHFLQAQAEVWNPGMMAVPGMLGGVFAQGGETQFLVLSRWRSMADHVRYLNEHFIALREQAEATEDLDRVTGDLVDLEPSWTVLS